MRAAIALLDDGMSVQQTAARVGLSERQLARRFRERVGTAPKVFARVMRLLRARDLLGARELADVAALAGVTPARLAREMSDSFNPALT